jgi:hypothetical protein
VAFLYACYGAATPRYDPYLQDLSGGPVEIAAAPLLSARRSDFWPAGPWR